MTRFNKPIPHRAIKLQQQLLITIRQRVVPAVPEIDKKHLQGNVMPPARQSDCFAPSSQTGLQVFAKLSQRIGSEIIPQQMNTYQRSFYKSVGLCRSRPCQHKYY